MKKAFTAAVLFCILLSHAFASDDKQKPIDEAKEDILFFPKIIEKFCSDMHICNQEKGSRTHFNVVRYREDLLKVKLPFAEKKKLEYCNLKYLVNFENSKMSKIFIYCADEKEPKLLVEQEVK